MVDFNARESDHAFRSTSRDYSRENDVRRDQYRPGYEPSAPPYFEPQHRQHENHLEDECPPPREPFLGPPDPHETLGWYLFSRTLRPVWRVSHTVLRVDLRRSLQYRAPRKGRGHRSAPAGTVASSGGRDYHDDEEERSPRGWLDGVSGGGARLKVMQEVMDLDYDKVIEGMGLADLGTNFRSLWVLLWVWLVRIASEPHSLKKSHENLDSSVVDDQVWDAPHNHLWESAHHLNLNVGFGMNFELDKGLLQPRFRVKASHVALHLFPRPELELRAKWPLGETRLAMNAKYRIPLTMSLADIWSSSGARIMVNFFNPLGSGFHLTPGGVDFDEHLVQLGEHTKLRIAAAVEFPRKFPLEEGEQPVKVQVHRFGLKTVIQPGVTI